MAESRITELPSSSIIQDHGEAPLEKQEGARIWHNSALSDVELFHGTYQTHAFARHFHSVPAIGVVDHGSMRTYCRSAHHHLPTGSVLLLNPGEVHAPGPTGERGWSFRMFYFGNSIFQECSEKVAEKVVEFRKPIVEDRLLARALLRLHRELEAHADALEMESALLSVFDRLVQNHTSASVSPSPSRRIESAVNRAKEYLTTYYRRNVSLAELAEVAEISQFHLVRSFHREVGLPPHSYLIQIRIETAKRLLQSGKPASEVASLAGFADQSHFTRHFKRWTGVTPGGYRPHLA